MKKATQLLESATDAIEDRHAIYDHPSRHFARTIGAINAIFAHKLREPFEPHDWPIIMSLDKFAREQGSIHPDNPVDVVGYMACRAEVMPQPTNTYEEDTGDIEDRIVRC